MRAGLADLAMDGWLLYDFRGQNPTALELLGLTGLHLTRRFFYWIPQSGEPVHVVHAIERDNFPALPGRQAVFSSRAQLEAELEKFLRGRRRIAMEYCEQGRIPYLSRVDAGTKEWIRTFGPEVASSADLVQRFTCVWTPAQLEGHRRAVLALDEAKDAAFAFVRSELAAGRAPLETEIQQRLMVDFGRKGLATDAAPIVAVNAHAGSPHYRPDPARPTPVKPGDLLLIDLWGKLAPHDRPDAGYADITWTGFAGTPPPEIAKVFGIVAAARDAALEYIAQQRARGGRVQGFRADQAARQVIEREGYGERFVHRTGHNIGCFSAHGDGAHLDDYESNDFRELLPGTAFSIEPGIYLDDFGIRSEIDVYLAEDGPKVFSPIQRELVRLA